MKVLRAAALLGLSTPLVVAGCAEPAADDGTETTSNLGSQNPEKKDSLDAGGMAMDQEPKTQSFDKGDAGQSSDGIDNGGTDRTLRQGAQAASASTSANTLSDAGGLTAAEPSVATGGGAGLGAGGAGALGGGGTGASGGSTAAGGSDLGGTGGSGGASSMSGASCPAGQQLCFGAPMGLVLGAGTPVDLALGQWDGQPGLDVLVASNEELAYFSNDGSGVFGAAQTVVPLASTQTFREGPSALAVGNFDSDGMLDVLIGRQTWTEPVLAFGDGQQGVSPYVEPPFGEGSLSDFFVADVAGSGPSDDFLVASGTDIMLVVTSGQSGEAYLEASLEFYGGYSTDAVLANIGSGQWIVYGKDTSLYHAELSYDPAAGSLSMTDPLNTDLGAAPDRLDVGDFNEDGFDDVVTTLVLGGIAVAYSDGNGDFLSVDLGQFPAADLPSDIEFASDVKTGDFNGDTHTDIAVTVPSNDAIAVFTGDGSGAFDGPVWVSTGASTAPTRLVVADLNGDQIDDLATVGALVGKLVVIVSEP